MAWSDPLLSGTELCSGRGTCPGGQGQAWAGVTRRRGRSPTWRRPPPKEAWTGRPCPSVGSWEHVSNSCFFSLCVELNLPIKELPTPPLGSAGMRTGTSRGATGWEQAALRPSVLGVTHREETSARCRGFHRKASQTEGLKAETRVLTSARGKTRAGSFPGLRPGLGGGHLLPVFL